MTSTWQTIDYVWPEVQSNTEQIGKNIISEITSNNTSVME